MDEMVCYMQMLALIEKLKLLGFDKECVTSLKMKPLSRQYFSVRKNPGEQFFLFARLAAWLVRKNDRPFVDPHEYDDPNVIVSNILESARALGFTADFPANKLKQGQGVQVVNLLDFLADEALTFAKFTWKRPEPIIEQETAADVIDDESELILDRVEDLSESEIDSDESFDHKYHNIDDLNGLTVPKRNEDVLKKWNIDVNEWQMEVERVLPQLKVSVKSDNRDWRVHLDSMLQHKTEITKSTQTTKSRLEKLHSDLLGGMEKIENREKYLNQHLEPLIEQYMIEKDEVGKLEAYYGNLSGGVAKRNRELLKLNDQLEAIKRKTEEKGTMMTDETPLVNIRRTVAAIKQEIREMDIRVGVLQEIYFQTKIRDRTNSSD